jgi:hypothetical protein
MKLVSIFFCCNLLDHIVDHVVVDMQQYIVNAVNLNANAVNLNANAILSL